VLLQKNEFRPPRPWQLSVSLFFFLVFYFCVAPSDGSRHWEKRPRRQAWREMHGQRVACGRGEKGKERGGIEGPKASLARLADDETRRRAALWGNTKLRTEATYAALRRGILVGRGGRPRGGAPSEDARQDALA
jgi:hypothetical protein